MSRKLEHDGIKHIGEKYGKLTILKLDKNYRKTKAGYFPAYYLCQCECGNTVTSKWNKIETGHTKSCGCLNNFSHFGSKPYRGASFSALLKIYKSGAEKRGLVFDLELSKFEELIASNCFYCGEPPYNVIRRTKNSFLVYTGIDRVDNTKGYIEDNCVPCCKYCNIMKMNNSLESFEKQITKIYNFYILNKKENNEL